ncbi:ArsR/SmtB family transcription factor [Halocatena marina]|uniref:ArsR/SmtB family transcription factor n=1 Tax=Halocatena marina TaxID=2934937 RepID=A0ABD5YTA2_9EURY|nr:winged helix-turn-helix domain-containing protein [Halocatena marina]
MSSDENDPADAFAALGDPVRVGILEALAEQDHTDTSTSPEVGFADLRRRVGVRDSGRFRYHLEQLRDIFVTQTEDGKYRLTYAGTQVVTAIVAGVYTQRVSIGPTDIDSTCGHCGTNAVGSFEDGVLEVICEKKHPLFYWTLPPNAARGVTIKELIRAATFDFRWTIELVQAGICPDCYAPIETAVLPTADDGYGQSYRLRAHCEACKSTLDGPIGACLMNNPTVVSFYQDHDRALRDEYWWDLEFVAADAPIDHRTDPFRLDVSVRVDDEVLIATIDDNGHVTSTNIRTK